MSEEEAREWVRQRFGVSRETQLERFGTILLAEAERQNLIAASTAAHLWTRHLVDSAQLLVMAQERGLSGPWLDIGSGAGLPGLVVAVLGYSQVILVEPRARRAAFLAEGAAALGLTGVEVVARKVEAYRPARLAGIISARAVAALPALLEAGAHCADSSTSWLLPKGRNAQSEVEAARAAWHGLFHVEPSITDPASGIVIAREVRRK